MTNIGIIGTGYVGLTSAACLSSLGHTTICVDNDVPKVEGLRAGHVPIREPGLDRLVAEGTRAGRLRFETDTAALADTPMVLLCLPTPKGPDGAADTDALHGVLPELAATLPGDSVLVTKSTVPIGTAARLQAELDRPDISVVSNPEFLREGHAVDDFLHPDRIVIGAADSDAGDRVAALYADVDSPVLRLDPTSAELSKYAANAYLAVRLSYVNEITELCERVGADIEAVTAVLGRDPRIGAELLRPGPGWGGSCLPKDSSALLNTAENAGLPFAILRSAIEANAEQHERVVRKVRRVITGDPRGSIARRHIGLLGLTFKAGTADLRDSPALAVAGLLVEAGAEVDAYDPCVPAGTDLGPIQVFDDPVAVAKGGDCLVLLTEWPEFAALDWERMAECCAEAAVVDTRNILDPQRLRRAGFRLVRSGARALPV